MELARAIDHVSSDVLVAAICVEVGREEGHVKARADDELPDEDLARPTMTPERPSGGRPATEPTFSLGTRSSRASDADADGVDEGRGVLDGVQRRRAPAVGRKPTRRTQRADARALVGRKGAWQALHANIGTVPQMGASIPRYTPAWIQNTMTSQ